MKIANRYIFKDPQLTAFAKKICHVINHLDNKNFSAGLSIVISFFNSHVIPALDNVFNLGRIGRRWKNIYIAGTAYVNMITGDSSGNVKIKIPSGKKVVFYNSSDGVVATIDEYGKWNNHDPTE